MRYLWGFFLFLAVTLQAQSKYPQDYFCDPLEVPLVLSGTFAELRSNHFHSGLDIKTQGRVGLHVLASAEGYVSRIKVSHYGYGKALYITHPNGYTTVYAHLQKLAPDLEAYLKKKQYAKESYQIELFPKKDLLKVTKGQLIAYSGNTGGSGGPHLHFEIRDNQERPINPLLFGFSIKDTRAPLARSLYAYPLNDSSHVNGSNQKQKLRLIPLKNGNFNVETVKAYGKIGFGIESNDQQDFAANKNGLYQITTDVNGSKNFQIDFKRFSFSETKHLNRLIDYKHYKEEKKRIQKLFIASNNPLTLYKNVKSRGALTISDSTTHIYNIHLKDFEKNTTDIRIQIEADKKLPTNMVTPLETPYFVPTHLAKTFSEKGITTYIPKNTFYEDTYLDIKFKKDTIQLHEPTIALKKRISISFDVSKYNEEELSQTFISRLVGKKNYPVYSFTKRVKDQLVTRTKTLGTYTLTMDSIAPKIKAVNFKPKQWLSKYRFLKVKITDNLSGVSNYRATINGKFILMEYDYKKNTLTYNFTDNIVNDTKNELKVIVTDNVGNSSTFTSTFFKK